MSRGAIARIAAGTFASAMLFAAAPAGAAQLVGDGSFEASVSPAANQPGNSPAWTETDNVFGTPLCQVDPPANCGTGSGTAGPRSGLWWAWFGGSSTGAGPQTGSVSQQVTIPRRVKATLSFFLWHGTPASSGSGDETLTVRIDSTPLFSINRSTPGFTAYAPVVRDVSRFAGGVHTLAFDYSNPTEDATATNFSVDDVTLTTKPAKKCKKKKGKKGAAAAKKCKKGKKKK